MVFNAGRTNYNNAVETIVNKCKSESEASIRENIRSVGSTVISEESLTATNTIDFSELKTFTPTVEDSMFAQYEGAINGLRKGDKSYESDYAIMEKLGILITDTPSEYWIASRFATESSGALSFGARYIGCKRRYGR